MMTNINSVITTTSHVLQFCITYPLLVDLGGFAPPSRTLFLITVYAVLCIIYLFLGVVNLFGAEMTRRYNLFVLRPELFALLIPGLLAFCLSFVFGLLARIRHWP